MGEGTKDSADSLLSTTSNLPRAETLTDSASVQLEFGPGRSFHFNGHMDMWMFKNILLLSGIGNKLYSFSVPVLRLFKPCPDSPSSMSLSLSNLATQSGKACR